MKQFICTSILVLFSVLVFSQNHSIGLNISPGISKLFVKKTDAEGPSIPINPNFEINYIFQKNKKTAILSGIGIARQSFYNDYVDTWSPDRIFLDDYICLAVPIEVRYSPMEWFYLGTGVNNKIVLFSSSMSENFSDYSYMLDVVGTAGVEVDFWKLTYRLGLYAEAPLLHREYLNFGLETGLYYNF